ncbi:MAG TPA: class I SAM-dependent methyltransferase [Verrucomicrobiae bacterium]|jgi:hypothetical protein|nr:class I SAM-dependent methyltransferase [Verrucomicrobiae bacterium]
MPHEILTPDKTPQVSKPAASSKTKSSFKDFFARLYRFLKAFKSQPREAFEFLNALPAAVRGSAFSKSPSFAPPQKASASGAPADFNPLKAHFDSHTQGWTIYKWMHYFDIYDRHFRKFAGREAHILEVGIWRGGSLEMWRNYFGPKARIYGIDIDERCGAANDYGYTAFIGDQGDPRFWESVREKVPQVDVLIDDGSHKAKDQIVTLEAMLAHLAPGGVYLCEDIHRTEQEFLSYAQGLVKGLYAFDGSVDDGVRPSAFQKWIKAVHFYPYVLVIEKAEKPEEAFTAERHGTE